MKIRKTTGFATIFPLSISASLLPPHLLGVNTSHYMAIFVRSTCTLVDSTNECTCGGACVVHKLIPFRRLRVHVEDEKIRIINPIVFYSLAKMRKMCRMREGNDERMVAITGS